MKKTSKVIKEAKNLHKSFVNKIKTLNQLKKIFGKRPRKKKVVMCHGTFDIVHPGHIRQLIYAKSKGDILFVSVTVDKYLQKGPLRPYVPQELRALNLAAFEIVDYVLIDQNPMPIKNILELQPDYFVKGFEYALNGILPRTKEEIEALSSYGGEMIFSPGDIVYSSTNLLSLNKPNLSLDQLLILMQEEKINFEHLRKTLKKFQKLSVNVVGDLIIDKYTKCSVLGPSQKSPAFSVRADESVMYVGGAGVVAKHLSALGAEVTLTTTVGKDKFSQFALHDLKNAGVKVNTIIDGNRPTTIKERFFTDGNRLLLQVDKVDNSLITENSLDKICRLIKKSRYDAIVCSDFRHGIFNHDTIPKIIESIPKIAIKVADSQVSNRWGNILDFTGFDLITPNEREVRFALGDQDTTIRPLAQMLYNKAACRFLILKLGENGIMTYRSPGIESREFFYIDSFVVDLIDPIGAGDALLASATLGLVSSQNIVQASILGNLSAAFECSKLGNIPISNRELLEMTYNLEKRF